jgi:hypothetical protein
LKFVQNPSKIGQKLVKMIKNIKSGRKYVQKLVENGLKSVESWSIVDYGRFWSETVND